MVVVQKQKQRMDISVQRGTNRERAEEAGRGSEGGNEKS